MKKTNRFLTILIFVFLYIPMAVLIVASFNTGKDIAHFESFTLNRYVELFQDEHLLNLLRNSIVVSVLSTFVATTFGTVAAIVPLTIAAFPFVARLVESSLREVNPNIIETAQSMGATPMQILLRVMLPEAVPSLITNFTLAITTILGYTAMSGAIGGGGLGNIAIMIGYNRYKYAVLYAAVIVLVILVQVIQSFGTWLATKSDKRLKK